MTPPFEFQYDAAGNRTAMTDGLGSVSYVYDQLLRMTSETRSLTGVGSFSLSYGYNYANELTSMTDPFGATINYNLDSTGRINSVSGTSFAGVTQYASDAQYRASGNLKGLTYGNSRTLTVGYDGSGQVSNYEVSGIMKKSYQ